MGLDRLEKIVKAINTEASVRPLRGSFVPVDGEIVNFHVEMANSFPSLLAVAKAAKLVKAANARRANAQVQDCCVREDYEQSMGHACDQLTRALEQLEATP